jgi:acetoacetate decarboxylase
MEATIQQIKSSIMFGALTNDDLNEITQALKYRRSQLTRENVRSFRNGDMVKFIHPKTGRTHIGVVANVKIKNVTVREGTTNWNVPANMLQSA